LLLSDQTITYANTDVVFNLAINPTLFRCWSFFDENSKHLQYLVGDYQGKLSMLSLNLENALPTSLNLVSLGETVQPSTLTHLQNGMVFVGSHFGDSCLISLKDQKDENGHCFSVVKSFTNLAPICDFCVVDQEGQGQMVTCSGAHKDGSLRIIRNGIGIEELGSLEDMEGLSGIWSLRPTLDSEQEKMLVLSFLAESRIQIIHDGSLEELETNSGFILDEPTLFCCNVLGNDFIQVKNVKIIY
jgi:DNA damage-binding protein 1